MLFGWSWQKIAGKVITWAPIVVKGVMDIFEFTNADVTTLVAALVAVLTTIVGLIPAKQE